MAFDTDIIVAVDFDGTLTKQDGKNNLAYEIDTEAVEQVKKIKELGVVLILWTCREEKLLESPLKDLAKLGLTFDYVNEGSPKRPQSRKINADIYIDDKSYLNWDYYYGRIVRLKNDT